MTRARARIAIASLAAACALAACGSSPADDASSTVKSYLDAFAKGDGKKACSLMTAPTRALFVVHARPLTHTGDCATAVARLKPALSRAFKGVHVSQAKVAGSDAVVNVSAGNRLSPTLLHKEGGTWKVNAGPGTQ